MKNKNGFSLFELILAIGLIVILGGIAISVMNPGGQLAKARNSQRNADLNTIMNGVRSNIADYRNSFECASGGIPSSTALRMASAGTSTYDIADCLVPTYIRTMPFDPSFSGAGYTDNSDYDTGYTIFQSSTTGQVTISAPSAELGETISITR